MGGTTKQVGQANLATPEQSGFVNQNLQGATGQSQQAYSDLLQPYDPQQFQQSIVDPAMQAYEQNFMPAIQQRFVGANAGSSSALNQALASSAANLSSSLGAQQGQFYQQSQANKLGALGNLSGLSGQSMVDPIIQEGYNPTGALISSGGDVLSQFVPIIAKMLGLPG